MGKTARARVVASDSDDDSEDGSSSLSSSEGSEEEEAAAPVPLKKRAGMSGKMAAVAARRAEKQKEEAAAAAAAAAAAESSSNSESGSDSDSSSDSDSVGSSMGEFEHTIDENGYQVDNYDEDFANLEAMPEMDREEILSKRQEERDKEKGDWDIRKMVRDDKKKKRDKKNAASKKKKAAAARKKKAAAARKKKAAAAAKARTVSRGKTARVKKKEASSDDEASASSSSSSSSASGESSAYGSDAGGGKAKGKKGGKAKGKAKDKAGGKGGGAKAAADDSDLSDSDASASSDMDVDEKPTKVVKKIEWADSETMCRGQLKRHSMEKHYAHPDFDQQVMGMLVRCMIGVDNSRQPPTRTYRLCIVEEVTEYKREYKLGSRLTKKALNLRHGTVCKEFTMDKMSNQPFTNNECTKFREAMDMGGLSVVTTEECEKRRGARGDWDARKQDFTAEQVEKMVRLKTDNLANRKNITLARMAASNKLEEVNEELNDLRRKAPEMDAEEEELAAHAGKLKELESRKAVCEKESHTLQQREEERRQSRDGNTFRMSKINDRNHLKNEQVRRKKARPARDSCSTNRQALLTPVVRRTMFFNSTH